MPGICFAISGAVGISNVIQWRYWLWGVVGCAGIGCILALLLRSYRPVLGVGALVVPLLLVSPPPICDHESGPFFACKDNLEAITNALIAYQKEHGHLPPPYLADDSGQRMHSWRVLILPYLGYDELYARYRFDEPWNGPNNSLLRDEVVQVYRCPKDTEAATAGNTSYLAVVGQSALWSGPKSTMLVRPAGFGAPPRLLVVEVPNSGVGWTEPRDLSADADHRPDVSRYEVLRSGNHLGLNQAIAVSHGCPEITELWTIDELDAWIQGDEAKQEYYRAKRIEGVLGVE